MLFVRLDRSYHNSRLIKLKKQKKSFDSYLQVEMEIARLVEQNRTILSVGLHLNFADARTRVAVHLERNLDKGTIAGVHCVTLVEVILLRN